MRDLLGLFAAAVTGVVTWVFALWVVGALMVRIGLPTWLSIPVALTAAAVVCRYVWRLSARVPEGLAASIVLGAIVVGGVGFAGGFFGPMIFAPDANQGPMLGIFITGPLGSVAGAVGGAIRWAVKRG